MEATNMKARVSRAISDIYLSQQEDSESQKQISSFGDENGNNRTTEAWNQHRQCVIDSSKSSNQGS